MRLRDFMEQAFLAGADHIVARCRQHPPSARRLAAARLVAHRGAYDNRSIFENTLAAFETFDRAGGWGIELDVRWTREGVPVVSHDPDGRRLFGVPRPIADMDLATLQRRLPLVPTLASVVTRFGGRRHLMVEIKCLFQDDPVLSRERLQRQLGGLHPGRDYHLLSLDARLLERLAFAPSQACLPIARVNPGPAALAAIAHAWGGIAGHYALMRRPHIAALHHRGFGVGTGFVNSVNCLYRELLRGVDWLFSDRALALQRVLSRAQRKGGLS
ncbi:MAG TPA: glycerophosphodiester phosphodiesterase family protein [Desulfosarcina sp.]|nr:glycerophosphodiester phosphodiesterase family protein [Desulfosarcina sp.]